MGPSNYDHDEIHYGVWKQNLCVPLTIITTTLNSSIPRSHIPTVSLEYLLVLLRRERLS